MFVLLWAEVGESVEVSDGMWDAIFMKNMAIFSLAHSCCWVRPVGKEPWQITQSVLRVSRGWILRFGLSQAEISNPTLPFSAWGIFIIICFSDCFNLTFTVNETKICLQLQIPNNQLYLLEAVCFRQEAWRRGMSWTGHIYSRIPSGHCWNANCWTQMNLSYYLVAILVPEPWM